MKLKFWHILAIPALAVAMVNSAFAQTAEMFWIGNGGSGGDLEGIKRVDNPYRCVTLGDPKFPQVNPTPTNPDGSKATCYPAGEADPLVSFMGGMHFSDSIEINDPDTLATLVFGNFSSFGQTEANFGTTGKGLVPFPDVRLHANTEVSVLAPEVPIAEMDSSVSFYAEGLNCNCVPGETVSVKFELGADFSGQGSSVGVQVRAFSDVDMKNDTFTQCSPVCETSQLEIGTSRTFSVVITLSVSASGQ